MLIDGRIIQKSIGREGLEIRRIVNQVRSTEAYHVVSWDTTLVDQPCPCSDNFSLDASGTALEPNWHGQMIHSMSCNFVTKPPGRLDLIAVRVIFHSEECCWDATAIWIGQSFHGLIHQLIGYLVCGIIVGKQYKLGHLINRERGRIRSALAGRSFASRWRVLVCGCNSSNGNKIFQ